MAKRYGKEFSANNCSPAKKPRIESPRQGAVPKQKRQSVDGAGQGTSSDVWGDDFDDEAIEEMDFVVSQACSQNVNVSTDSRVSGIVQRESRCQRQRAESIPQSIPSTSRALNNYPTNPQILKLKDQYKTFPTNKTTNAPINKQISSQKLASSDNIRDMFDDDSPMMFHDFKTDILERGNLNSTFIPRNDIVVSDDARLHQLEKLKQEHKKLADEFTTKVGETVFLRKQLQQTQMRAENEKIEKTRTMEEQASRYRAEINALQKEKDNMKTQYEFQSLQLGSLMERCKLLESGAVKLTQPQKATVDSPNRSRLSTQNRSAPIIKPTKLSEIGVQTCSTSKPSWDLKTSFRDHPLDTIPQSIFEASFPEKSVVDNQIIETFEPVNLVNDLVKPVVTVVDERILNVGYFLPDLAVIMKNTSTEINSTDCIPIVNKIVSTTRELLLNTTVVLKTISESMNNDDIRAMNNLYFSESYDAKVDYSQSIFDANMWYETERGIEARRAVGCLSYIAKVSNYLGEYITGRTQLITENDQNYSNYDKKMVRYNAWPKKGHRFEILELILEFVTTLGLVRRSHQFSGLTCAIVNTLCNTQESVGFCPTGLTYISKIFKEIVFSRPLVRCFISLTNLIAVFCKSTIFGQNLCSSTQNDRCLSRWNGVLHFTPDACALDIYMAQMETFRPDPITTVNISDEFLSFVLHVFLTNDIPWTSGFSNPCKCGTQVLMFTITLLCNCSQIDLRAVEKEYSRSEASTKLGNNFWRRIRKKQINALRKGLRYLRYLAIRSPDFAVRVYDIEDSFYLFMHHVSAFKEVTEHENEQEAMALIKSTLMFNKPNPSEPRSQDHQQIFSVKSAFKEKPHPSPSSGQWFELGTEKGGSSQQDLSAYEDLFNDK